MKLISALLDLLYPPRCAFCHRLLRPGETEVCRNCRASLPFTGERAEREKLAHIARCVSPLYYEKSVRDSLHRYKFGHLTGYAGVYAAFMVKCIDENAISCDSITWAPVSRKRLRARGYDQSQVLAEKLAAHYGLPCVRMLRKTRDNPPQSLTKSAAERRRNVQGVYQCVRPEEIAGKRILLVDDIVTSGATLEECAWMLRQAGAAAVFAVTVARKRS